MQTLHMDAIAMENSRKVPPALHRLLAEAGEKKVLLFAHPGFEASWALIKTLNQTFPEIRVTLLTHVTLTKSQIDALPVENVLTFDKRARKHQIDLFKMGWNILRSVRTVHFDLALMWCRRFEVSPNRLLFELFAIVSRARKAFFWDDESGAFVRISGPGTFFIRLPWSFLKLSAVALFVLLVWLAARLALFWRGWVPVRPRRLMLDKAMTVGFLRTDIELAVMPMTVGGSVSHVKGMIQGFLAAGCTCFAYALGPLAGIDPIRVRTRVLRPWLSSDVPMEVIEAMASLPFVFKGLVPMRRDGIALIYQRYSMNNFAGLVLSRILRVPFVLEANNSEVVMRTQFSRLSFPFLARTLERLILLSADCIITVSERNRQTFSAMGIPADRIHVLPNAVDPEEFSPACGDGGLRQALGLEGKVVVGFVGLFYPWHGVTHLAKAFVRVAEVIPDTHLLLVGDGDERDKVCAILAEARVDHRVSLVGLVPHDSVPKYLQAMDIVVSPHAPWKEFFGSPVKLFEYMSSAKAIVASDVGQIRQIIRNGRNGLLFEAGDDAALAEAIIRLCRDEELREQLGQAARADVLARHTWQQTARQVLALAAGIPAGEQGVVSA